ncbi:thioredoxin [Velocimicrobium porci]|uniref:Thioredoxin n=1 Tax=Velocimicrobium porci TaxID=2606634 RepID=A0A6L5XX51_9FIRM|nr:thioredoxin [Velocimicrobium porci]MSS63322.1 thioredoxin [Velocimicrobium porci]
MAIQLTMENWKKEVMESEKPVLVDFWASWCNPCRMLSPVIDEIAKEAGGEYKVGKVNVDEQPELAGQFKIMSIPTLIVFKNGTVIEKSIGVKGKEEILCMVKGK